jgi:hypothetical protein
VARSSKSSKGLTKQSEDSDGNATVDAAEKSQLEADTVSETESVETEGPVGETENDILAKPEEVSDRPGDSDGSETQDVQEAQPDAVEQPETEHGHTAVPGVIPAHVGTPPPVTPPPVPVTAASTGPGAFGLVFGGILAGAIGFLVATFAVPEGWPNPEPSGLDGIASTVAENSDLLESLSAQMAEIRNASPGDQTFAEVPDLSPLSDQVASLAAQLAQTTSTIEDQFAGLTERLGTLESRLREVEGRPDVPAAPDGSAAMEAQLEAFRQQLDEVTADAENRISEAQDRASEIEAAAAEAAAAAQRQAALAALSAALDSGAPYGDTLAVFPEAPEPLVVSAADGVATLSSLQESFPDAARQALSSVQVVPDEASTGERFVAFLKRRTNARSLSPRDGDDPDAILSRAEAALADGDLGMALAELDALPEAAKNAMSDWIDAAETRNAAVSALASLETAMN